MTTREILGIQTPQEYPYDFPQAVYRALPQLKIPLMLASTNWVRDLKVMVDVDESGLIAIHSAMADQSHGEKYTVTHPPSGVCFLQDLTFEQAIDLSNYLAAHLDRIEQLVLDYTTPNPNKPRACTLVSDPGNINAVIRQWISDHL
jgi:hypothetical protein